MDKYEQELNSLFSQLKNQVDLSFEAMQSSLEMRDQILKLWEKKLREFVSYTLSKSQQYNDKGVFKTLAKALLFR